MSTPAVRRDAIGGSVAGHTHSLAQSPQVAQLVLAFAAVYLIWGSTFLAIRFAVETIPPLLTMSARSGGAGVILYLAARMSGAPAPERRQWVQALIVGGLLFLVCHGVLAWAEQRIASGPAALLASTIPLWMVLFDWLGGTGPRPGLGVILGLSTGFAGVAMLVLPSDHTAAGGVDILTGFAMMCGSASWVAGSLYSRRAGFPRSVALATGMQLLGGGFLLLVASLAFGEMHRLAATPVSARSIWSLIYLIVFGSVVAFTAYNWLLRVTTPARLSTYLVRQSCGRRVAWVAGRRRTSRASHDSADRRHRGWRRDDARGPFQVETARKLSRRAARPGDHQTVSSPTILFLPERDFLNCSGMEACRRWRSSCSRSSGPLSLRGFRMRRFVALSALVASVLLAGSAEAATTYEVGPGKVYDTIGAVPWESLQPGDIVLIYWRATPYQEKWVICRQGTAAAPIIVRGIPGPNGELPIIDGNGATTRSALNYWNQERGVIKIGGANVPADTTPKFITIEKLDIRSARPPYTFTAANGSSQAYTNNASSIYIEKGENITIRGNAIHDSGNGFFVASSDELASRDILVEANYIYDNGNQDSIYEHNNYTAAIGITFQYNRFGPLRAGAQGNNLKDRSAGLVVRYNWIEGGNRQLDLVDGEDSALIRNDARYHSTFVYGNVLLEPDGAGNRQIVHYGGDSGSTMDYRKGTLYFYNNTIVSYRTDRNTFLRLSSNEEHADVRNNIIYSTLPGDTQSLLDDTGILDISHNWLKPGWVSTFNGSLSGVINDDGTSVPGTTPGFLDESAQKFRLVAGAEVADAGTVLSPAVLPTHDITREYVKHQRGQNRPRDSAMDIGAFELAGGQIADLVLTTSSLPNGKVGTFYSTTLSATGGLTPYTWSQTAGTMPPGLSLNAISGTISGVPVSSSISALTFRVADARNPADSDSRTFSLIVSQASALLNITTLSLPNARRNKDYAQLLQATGGVKPYTWSVYLGKLPPGLAIHPTYGAIYGRATTLGTWQFVVKARDSQSNAATDTQTLTIKVVQ